MKCIFCLNDRPGTEEHVFPRAIGGMLTTDRVCKPCNSILGSRVDAALSDNFLVRAHRARLQLAGNSGEPPGMHELLLGVGHLADNPERRVEVTFDKSTQNIVTRVLHHSSDVIMPDGSSARYIVVDEKDAGELPKIIKRERQRHGAPPLTTEQMDEQIKKFRENLQTIENPKIIFNKILKFHFVRHALIKIAYELAFLWLGEDYLDDPSAAELRAAICSNDPSSTDQLPAYVSDADGFEAFNLWPENETEHLAYAFVAEGAIGIAVRIFNIHAAFVWVTNNASQFLSHQDANQRLRFMRIDSINGKMLVIPISEEFARINAEVAIKRNGTKKNLSQIEPPYDQPSQ